MIGMLLWKEPVAGQRQKTIRVAECSILHMRFLCVEILKSARTPEAVLRRRVLSAARKLQRNGVTQAVLPAEFFCPEQLEKAGVRPVSTLELRRALAAELVRAEMKRKARPADGKVAVVGEHLTGEIVRTVTELALQYRYLLLDLPYGGESLCRQLRREYGVSVQLTPSGEQLGAADTLVLFCERNDLTGSNTAALQLYEGGAEHLPPLVLPPAMEEQLPAGVNRPQMLAALLGAGALRRGQISIGTGQS